MIRTPVCDLLDIEHPIALGGMGSIYSPDLVAAVSRAGGFGAMGCHHLSPDEIRAGTAAVRERTNKPFALNFILFDIVEERFAAALALQAAGNCVCLAAARPGPQVLRCAGAWCGLQGHGHGGRSAGGRQGGGMRRRCRDRPGHRRRRPCRLAGDHGAGADGGRRGRAGSGAGRRRHCGRPRPRRRDRARGRWRAARHALPGEPGIAAPSKLQAGDRGQRRPRHAALRDSGPRGRKGLAGRDVALEAQPLHRALGRAGMGPASAAGAGARDGAGGAQERRHRRGAAVDGAGRRPDPRHSGRRRDRRPHRAGGGADSGREAAARCSGPRRRPVRPAPARAPSSAAPGRAGRGCAGRCCRTASPGPPSRA